jgi:hypothetical protein
MTDQTISPRYELKQTYSRLLLPELRSWVKTHPAGFRQSYPPRQVNSIYFETPDLDTFNDHLEGVPVRRKLRYRWYGTNLGEAQAGQVEVKNKSELAGWKLIEKLDASFNFEHNNWASLQYQMRNSSHGVIKELLAVSRPALLTVYDRDYFESADGTIRLTIDSNLRAYDQYMQPAPNLKFLLVNDPVVILELKSDVNRIKELTEALSHFPERASRYSKFVSNMMQIL